MELWQLKSFIAHAHQIKPLLFPSHVSEVFTQNDFYYSSSVKLAHLLVIPEMSRCIEANYISNDTSIYNCVRSPRWELCALYAWARTITHGSYKEWGFRSVKPVVWTDGSKVPLVCYINKISISCVTWAYLRAPWHLQKRPHNWHGEIAHSFVSNVYVFIKS